MHAGNTHPTASPCVPSAPMFERPGSFDWEVLADADAEYHEWQEAQHEAALAVLDADPDFALEIARDAA